MTGAAIALLLGVASLLLPEGTSAGEIVDRRYVAIPPAYPAPPAGFLRLPSSVPALPAREPHAATGAPTWHPSRAEIVVGLDARGRITHALEHTPGRLDR